MSSERAGVGWRSDVGCCIRGGGGEGSDRWWSVMVASVVVVGYDDGGWL